jgi:maleylpyruvate isomerase
VSARAWMDTGTKLFLEQLDGLGDTGLDGPSALPGWTRRHLVAHLHFNACALIRLASWAETGVENRMYRSPDQRAAEIDEGAGWDPARLLACVHESAADLAKVLDGLSDEAWSAPVVTAQGRTVPASEIPWLRAREVMVHAIDLDTGLFFTDLPGDFVDALLAEVIRKRAVAGQSADLTAWLTGRTAIAPDLGPWL